MDIREVIERIVKPLFQKQVVIGTVKSIDANDLTCDVEVENSYIRTGVRLKAIESNALTGFILMPTVGSSVSIRMVEDSRSMWELSMVSEVDTIYLKSDQYGGLPITPNLVQKLNVMENDLNVIKTVFTTWVPVPNDGGAALKSAALSWAGQQLTATVDSDIENPNVKHG